MSTEDAYTLMPVDGGPGVYVADPGWFDSVLAKNRRLIREEAERATQDGDQPA